MSLTSMTGFADLAGGAGGLGWAWEARSVNGRGLDVRLRLPDGVEGLEPVLRQALTAALARGSVTVALRFGRETAPALPRLNLAALETALAAAEEARQVAGRMGVALAPMTAAELVGLRGVLELDHEPASGRPEVMEALRADVARLVAALVAARRSEGAALAGIISGQLDAVARLVEAAQQAAEARAARSGALLRARVEALLGASSVADEARLAQELALIAVKADLTEEIDRLAAHVDAGRALVAGGGAVGRKLDFLVQEFNREANTLCAKAQSSALTAIGLDLKAVIDQLREQVQNVE